MASVILSTCHLLPAPCHFLTIMNAPEKLDFKRILPIIVIVLVDLLGLTIIIPLLPLYATAFGANAVVIGILNAAYPMMQLIGAPILGSLSDRFGRKPVLLVSQMGTFVGFCQRLTNLISLAHY